MRKLFIILVFISLCLHSNLVALKRDYNWLDDFCVTHFPYQLPPGISMDLMNLIPEKGPLCTGIDYYSDMV